MLLHTAPLTPPAASIIGALVPCHLIEVDDHAHHISAMNSHREIIIDYRDLRWIDATQLDLDTPEHHWSSARTTEELSEQVNQALSTPVVQ